jgi:hypothetical protein
MSGAVESIRKTGMPFVFMTVGHAFDRGEGTRHRGFNKPAKRKRSKSRRPATFKRNVERYNSKGANRSSV